MKLRVSFFLAALLAIPASAQTGAAAPDEPQGVGPRGSSQPVAGERRFDAIGYTAIGTGEGVAVSAPGLPKGFAEVTAVDTGKTIVAIVDDIPVPAGRIATISPAAAAALGLRADPTGVRVRPVSPPGAEIAALRAGQANARMDAPPALLAALRRKLPPLAKVAVVPPSAAKAAIRRPTARPVTAITPVRAPAPAASAPSTLPPGLYVQLAALSTLERATALSRKTDGVIERTDRVFRVHRGPYASEVDAKRERARAAALGYPDSQIVRIIP
jgi:rare lipoprotein A